MSSNSENIDRVDKFSLSYSCSHLLDSTVAVWDVKRPFIVLPHSLNTLM